MQPNPKTALGAAYLCLALLSCPAAAQDARRNAFDDPFVEGLVRIDALSDDFYTFDEARCRLTGRRSGRVFALGDSVKVEVQSVSVVRRKVDFALAEHAARQRDHRRGERRRGGKEDGRKKHRRGAADKREARRGERGERGERDQQPHS